MRSNSKIKTTKYIATAVVINMPHALKYGACATKHGAHATKSCGTCHNSDQYATKYGASATKCGAYATKS